MKDDDRSRPNSFSMVKNTPNPSDPSKLDENDGMQQTSNSLENHDHVLLYMTSLVSDLL